MKKKFLALTLASAMCLGSLAGCSKSSSTAEPGATNPAGEAGSLTGTLKVGTIGPMTGGAALYGNATTNGGQIAVDQINALGNGFKIDYKAEDDEHDAEKSVNAYNKLKDWGVQVIDGTTTTTPCVAVSAEAFSDRIFMMTPSASSTTVTDGKDNMYQICFSDPNQGNASAQYISENKLATKVAIIYNNADAYSTGIYQTFKAKAEELSLEIVSTTTFTDDTANDFSVQLNDAKSNGADLIFLPIYYTPASLILKQAADMKYDVKFFGVDGMDGILGLEGFDTKLAEGVMLLTPFSADATDDLTKTFVTSYEDKYKETPIQFAADSYDVIYAFYNALKFYADKNGGYDVTDKSAEDICKVLIEVYQDPSFKTDGLTGAGMTWNNKGEVSKAPKAVVIENGAYKGM